MPTNHDAATGEGLIEFEKIEAWASAGNRVSVEEREFQVSTGLFDDPGWCPRFLEDPSPNDHLFVKKAESVRQK